MKKKDLKIFFLLALYLLFIGEIIGQTTFADNFSSPNYNRQDGTANWSTDWIESGDSNNGPTSQYIRIQSQQLYMYYLWTEDIRRTANLTGATAATLSFDYTTNNLGGTRQLGVYISSTGGAPYTQIGTLSGNGAFTQDISAFISANTVIRFAKSNANWGSSDNANIDNVLISAVIPVDTDGDGIEDVADLDNDNDGILDWEECTFIATTTQNFSSSGGTSVTNTASSGRGIMYIDFISIDNSFNLTVNGTNIATEFQFQPGAPGNFARFDTGFTYGQGGVPQLWSMTGTLANPMLRVIVDADGNLKLFGAQSSGGALVPLTLDTPPVTVPWNPSGTNTITIGQFVTGPTNMNGQIRFSGECDTDGDGIFNRFDLDSDNDGIYDAVEAGHGQVHTNGVVNGTVGTDGVPDLVQTDPNGGSVNYTNTDSDGDGILDSIELDSDNDGCNDVLEAGFTDNNADGLLGPIPVTTDGNGVVNSGTDGYTIPADGDSDAVFDYRQSGAPPSITAQPVNAPICPGCNGSLSVSATNADLYQWQRFTGGSWTDITDNAMFSGANTATLTISNPTPSQNGEQYRVILNNLSYVCTSSTSTIASLQIQVNTIVSNRRITYRVQKN